jgi:hypothetical protein
VSWSWKAGGAPTSDNPAVEGSAMVDGIPHSVDSIKGDSATITPSKMSVNTKAGFSIVKYFGNNEANDNQAIPSGLDSLDFVICKDLDDAEYWFVYHKSLQTDHNLYLQTSDSSDYVGDNGGGGIKSLHDTNGYIVPKKGNINTTNINDTHNFIAYCWKEIPGYSAFGSYEGNNVASGPGPFVHTGFRPAFVMLKNSDATGPPWEIYDSARGSENGQMKVLVANASTQEDSQNVEFLSNGFRIFDTNSWNRNEDSTYIYMAFADSSALGELKTKSKKNPISVNSKQGFNAVTWTGQTDGGAYQGGNITTGFQPDLVWIKNRDSSLHANLFDSVRGVQKAIYSSTTQKESTDPTTLNAFASNGFSVGSNIGVNENTKKHIAWCWKAGGAPDAGFKPDDAMIDGEAALCSDIAAKAGATITPTSMSVNTKAGFSIVKYSGSGDITHGLSSPLDFLIVKNLDLSGEGWATWHSALDSSDYLYLNSAQQKYNSTDKFSGKPDSNVFKVGSDNSTGSSSYNYIAYCWHSVPGYSAFGSYVGNGSPDGPFIYTGFKPAFLIVKRITGSFSETDGLWTILDSTRRPFNGGAPNSLYVNNNSVEYTNNANRIDFFSNGFKLADSNNNVNSANEFIYIAFAEQPYEFATSR